MSYHKHRDDHYDEVSQAWESETETAVKKLDQIVQVIKICQSTHEIVLFFLPIPLMTVFRYLYLTNYNRIISEFKGTIMWESWAVILSSVFYVISLVYNWPIITYFWDFFHQQIDLKELWINLWQFATFQAAIVLLLHLACTGLACRSFTILPTFQERYDELKTIRDTYQETRQAEILIKARMLEQLPVILTTAISTQMNTILTALVLNEEQAQQLQKTLPQAVNSIVDSVVTQFDRTQAKKNIEAVKAYEEEYDD